MQGVIMTRPVWQICPEAATVTVIRSQTPYAYPQPNSALSAAPC